MIGIKFDKADEFDARRAWLLDNGRLAKQLGFSVVEFGRRWSHDGEVWEIAGLYRKAGKFRIVCRHVETGELRRFSKTLVRACAPAPEVVR